ncbi:DUF547 domain-containing protein [Erythrobacter sp.]|uniref:DUF547 domain-containing protein n=1 Tax=Erythrobacter sp. TaxID=1042 RepID=UPI001425E7C4|nr:DUF547 domain-containing protein [Erythrobacter sp.]QIQ85346.1 MAG: DUF547 domain-containing protein [Erythrobacter sp.]
MQRLTAPILALAAALVAPPALARGEEAPVASADQGSDRYATFVPKAERRQHRIDYSVWTEALAAFVVDMGPPLRKMPTPTVGTLGTNMRIGHNSIYRLDGSMVGFSLMDGEVIANIAQYRRDLEKVADELDIQSLPRNEQLAYWLNLHNVAMIEVVAANWPERQPREIEVDGVPLDEARFITVEGVALSPRDIRERIVFANWKSPEVFYGFWRGEIGGPAMQRTAFEGRNVGQQLADAAEEFINSRRGTEKRGGTLHVSEYYAEIAPFFFPDFEADLRAHLAQYVEGKVARMLEQSERVKPSLYEHDIADLAGGRRNNAFFANGRLDPGAAALLAQRERKLEYVRRKVPREGRIFFSNIDLPGDPPDKNEVE